MYRTRDSLDNIEKCGENKQDVINILNQLAEMGWKYSCWGNCGEEGKKTIVNVYSKKGKVYKKGATILECYQKALKEIQSREKANQKTVENH